ILERKNSDALLGNRSRRAMTSRHRCWWRPTQKNQGADNQGNRGRNKSDKKHELRPTRSGDRADANSRRVFPPSWPEFFRDLWIAETILVEVKQMQAQPVLHLARAQIVEVRLPMAILGQIFRHVRRQKNVSGVTAIQHSLRNIDSRTGY